MNKGRVEERKRRNKISSRKRRRKRVKKGRSITESRWMSMEKKNYDNKDERNAKEHRGI